MKNLKTERAHGKTQLLHHLRRATLLRQVKSAIYGRVYYDKIWVWFTSLYEYAVNCEVANTWFVQKYIQKRNLIILAPSIRRPPSITNNFWSLKSRPILEPLRCTQ